MDEIQVPAGAAGLIAPPWFVAGSSLFLTGEDALRVAAFNAAAGVTLRLAGRFLPVGEARPRPFASTFVPATDRTVSTLVQGLGEGWLLEASVIASAGSPLVGQTFVTLAIQRGLTTSALELSVLGQGYVTARQRVGTPGAWLQNSIDGGGAIRSITGSTPAAAAEISETVPTGARWELLAIRFRLVTDANVANRAVSLVLDDGTNLYFHSSMNVNQTAGVTWNYAFVQGFGNPAISQISALMAVIPANNRLGAGHRIRTSSTLLQAGDQFGIVQYLVREWIEGA